MDQSARINRSLNTVANHFCYLQVATLTRVDGGLARADLYPETVIYFSAEGDPRFPCKEICQAGIYIFTRWYKCMQDTLTFDYIHSSLST